MTITIGDRIPDISLKRLGESGMEEIRTGDYFKGRKIVLFATPGAFTPACTQKHLPGYIAHAPMIKSKGIDEIICLSVNDPFVMKRWDEETKAEGRVTMLPDGNGDFIRALGLGMDASGHGLGFRARRFLMVVDDGIVKDVQVEDKNGEVSVSGAESCMSKLES